MKDLWRRPYHVIIEVENRQCHILKKLSSMGLKHMQVVDIRGSGGGPVKHLLYLDPEETKNVSELKTIAEKGRVGNRSSIWLESKGCDVCSTILSCDAFLVSGKGVEGSKIMYSFMVPSFEAFQKILATMEGTGNKVNILKVGRFERRAGILTEKQEKILWLAMKGGFFDYPRRIDTGELSKKLGISPSTLSEILRRGTRRLLENYFKTENVYKEQDVPKKARRVP